MHLQNLQNVVNQLVIWLARFYPQFEILFRTDGKINHIKISRKLQLSIFVVIFIGVGWSTFASFNFFINNEVVTAKTKEIIKARMAYRGLLSEVNDYQDKFSNLTADLSKNHGLMLNLVEKNATLQQNVKSAVNKLETSKSRHKHIVLARTNLKEKLTNIQIELKSLNNHNFSLKGNLSSVTTDLESALSERNRARSNGEKLSQTVIKLQNDLEVLNKSENAILQKLTDSTKEDIQDIRYVLKRTGLNVKRLISVQVNITNKKAGLGGPFVAYKPSIKPAQNLQSKILNLNNYLKELEELKGLMKKLPLSTPLNYYQISSHFGKRRDPINKRWAVHTGLDFSGYKNSRVYATAPGKVTFAGRNGKYGKLIEIDHGLGFKTKYRHLNKILVKNGQKVDYRAKIGLMGSTGRSTGPHLHYEILVKGRHHNPWRLIKAGRYVYKR
jgi:murein DD-endopeptidase MepM/ murein hydrolase activator NlpD